MQQQQIYVGNCFTGLISFERTQINDNLKTPGQDCAVNAIEYTNAFNPFAGICILRSIALGHNEMTVSDILIFRDDFMVHWIQKFNKEFFQFPTKSEMTWSHFIVVGDTDKSRLIRDHHKMQGLRGVPLDRHYRCKAIYSVLHLLEKAGRYSQRKVLLGGWFEIFNDLWWLTK